MGAQGHCTLSGALLYRCTGALHAIGSLVAPHDVHCPHGAALTGAFAPEHYAGYRPQTGCDWGHGAMGTLHTRNLLPRVHRLEPRKCTAPEPGLKSAPTGAQVHCPRPSRPCRGKCTAPEPSHTAPEPSPPNLRPRTFAPEPSPRTFPRTFPRACPCNLAALGLAMALAASGCVLAC